MHDFKAPYAGPNHQHATLEDMRRQLAWLAARQKAHERRTLRNLVIVLTLILSASALSAVAEDADLISFSAGQVASAADVNHNFSLLKTWIAGKVGAVGEPTSINTSGAVSAGTLTSTGDLIVHKSGAPSAIGDRRGLQVSGVNDPLFVGLEARDTGTDDWDAVVSWGDNSDDRLRFRTDQNDDSKSKDVMTLAPDGTVEVAGNVKATSFNGKALSLDCVTKTATVSGGDDKTATVKCASGYTLTGCGMLETHKAQDGTKLSSDGNSCIGQNGGDSQTANLWARCCRIN